MEHYSPLRYPGGKGKISGVFKSLIRENNLYDCIYIEPYAGGASVGLSLLFNEYVKKIIINDIDRSIYAFWHSVLHENKALCDLIRKTPINLDVWRKQKKIQMKKKNCDLLELGFSTFFLNRTNRSGILSAGVIGGKEQKGNWKINARYNQDELIKRIKRIALYKNKIEVYNLDALNLIKKIKPELTRKTLFYFDPPYYHKGKELYLNHYLNTDHVNVAKEIKKIKKFHWIVTYDDVKPIRRLYKEHKQIRFDISYSAGKSAKGEEIMVFSDNLIPIKKALLA